MKRLCEVNAHGCARLPDASVRLANWALRRWTILATAISMSSPPPLPTASSVLQPQAQTFPVLTPEQIDRIRGYGKVRQVERGEVLFEPNQNDLSFFVVLSGAIEIMQPGPKGDRLIVTHKAGQFTGEISMISGQSSLARGRMDEPGEVLEVRGEDFRTLVAKDAQLSEMLMRAFILRRLALIDSGFGNVVVMGSQHSARTLELREFLTRNLHPHVYLDLDSDQVSQSLLDRFQVKASEVPVVICNGTDVLRNPTIGEVAQCLGMNRSIDAAQVRDLIIVGAGPAGLAAAVYAATEGLDVLVIESRSPGGQAGSSSKIENYLGFPLGISGLELAARATNQAMKFGATLRVAQTVTRLDCSTHPYRVQLQDGGWLLARSIIIATGAQYVKPLLENLERFEGNGIYYGATYMEAQMCKGREVAVVGGGNSAGQATAYLSETSPMVHMLERGPELRDTMSRYLIQRLTEHPRIQLHLNTEIVALEGDDCLQRIQWRDKQTGETSAHDIQHLFIMAGASPQTAWLDGCLAMDDKGFILTGADLKGHVGEEVPWPAARAPQMLETSLPGVFAVGDVRSGNVKRVAGATGEGAIAIHMVHRALAGL
jgi:thioredoxin reductase (NADPH)